MKNEKQSEMALHNSMIVAKGKPITFDIQSYSFNQKTEKWFVTFKNGKTFNYSINHLLILSDSKQLNPSDYQINFEGINYGKISSIISFKYSLFEYWRIIFESGYAREYYKGDLEIHKSALDNNGSKSIFNYLNEVANQISVHTEDDTAILSKQYAKINFINKESVAACYLSPSLYKNKPVLGSLPVIFPFGCNESQFTAVHNALSNTLSAIEGPPGTGKTQTILNIIANLLLRGKTVQVCSNNNSAIENVLEKLASPKYQMDFFVASLGRAEKKEKFILNQTGKYPDLCEWDNKKYSSKDIEYEISYKSHQIQSVFRDNNTLAQLRLEKQKIEIENNHFIKDSIQGQIFSKLVLSTQVLDFLNLYQNIIETKKRWKWSFKRKCRHLGIRPRELKKYDAYDVIIQLQKLYYATRLKEVNNEISNIEKRLSTIDANKLNEEFSSLCLGYFRNAIAKRFNYKKDRIIFTDTQLWISPNAFLKEYPVVLSTTYTSRSCIGEGIYFDYVIIDESSQVDVATGLLALSSATNAVIVGDSKQLQHVVTSQQEKQLIEIFTRYSIPKAYEFTQHSLLSSVYSVFNVRIPKVILKEHYRCAPLIIGFCNQKFYNNELIIMTKETDDSSIQLVMTVAGNHQRDRINQRQIDVICSEILPKLKYSKNQIGIISPYRDQVYQLQKTINDSEIEIDTVHKFQGREKDVIIFCTVDDKVTSFSDDSNLLNVAVSRAKKQFIIITSNEEQPLNSNVGDLIGYIKYNKCSINKSMVNSVFDYLYSQYAEARLQYLKSHGRISEYDSENLMYGLISDVLKEMDITTLGVILHQSLQLLIQDLSKFDKKEQEYIKGGWSHIDFLIYNKITKKPFLAIEVDGFDYHKEGTKQSQRDVVKNHILEICNLPLIRFSTNGSMEKEKLKKKINELYLYS